MLGECFILLHSYETLCCLCHRIIYIFELEGGIDLKWAKILYLQSSCMSNIYISINKPQLNQFSENEDSVVYVLLTFLV